MSRPEALTDWVATDLDSTLFNRAWHGPEAVPGTWRAITGPDGQPAREASSWIRRETYHFLRALSPTTAMVAVTARDVDSFSRVDVEGLCFTGPAILANGAIVLGWDGLPDKAWEEQMSALLAPWQPRLQDFCERLIQRCGGSARPRLVAGSADQSAYLVAKAADGWWHSPAGIEVIGDSDWWHGCCLAVLGNELQVLPPGLGKLAAVRYVQETWFAGRPPLLAMGDMHSDLDFMRLGGLMATPPGSALDQLWKNQQGQPPSLA